MLADWNGDFAGPYAALGVKRQDQAQAAGHISVTH
jgi:hypothetical protein